MNKDKELLVQDVSLGKILARLMDQTEISQTDLANKAKTDQPTISAICNGRRQCGPRLAARLAEALGLQGHDYIAFVAESKKPKYKGFDHHLYGPEASIYDIMTKALAKMGIDPKQMQGVVPPQKRGKNSPDAVIIMKDGRTYAFTLSVQPQFAHGDIIRQATAEEIKRHIGEAAEKEEQSEVSVSDTHSEGAAAGEPQTAANAPAMKLHPYYNTKRFKRLMRHL